MRNRAAHIRDSKGFSLTELLVVIALAATMLAIGAPSIISQISHQRLNRSVREIAVELNAARFKAIAQNKRYQVEFTVNAGTSPADSFQLQYWDGAAYADEPNRIAGVLGDGITITSPGTGTFTTEFYPNGSATATSICIENTNKANDRMKVTVKSTTGMIQVATGCI